MRILPIGIMSLSRLRQLSRLTQLRMVRWPYRIALLSFLFLLLLQINPACQFMQEASAANPVKASKGGKTASASPKVDPSTAASEGLKLIQAGQYARAKPYFAAAATRNPDDVSVLYYLGLCSIYAQDYQLARRALARALVISMPSSQFRVPTEQLIGKYKAALGNLDVYPAFLQFGDRWKRGEMPVKIYITNGLQLPPKSGGQNLHSGTVVELTTMLNNPQFYAGLGRAQGYEPRFSTYVAQGFNRWSFMANHGLTFKVVASPAAADIVVFWWYNAGTPGLTFNGRTRKIIMQFDTYGRSAEADVATNLADLAAHEFGHALGVLGHSEKAGDLMSPGVLPRTNPTQRDRDTMIALYDFPSE